MNSLFPVLEAAFKDRAFKPSDCIEENSNPYSLVFDDPKTNLCVFADPNGLDETAIVTDYFRVQNPQGRTIQLLKLDGCFVKNRKGGMCDCTLFTEAEWCFLEFKLNAPSYNPNTISENRVKAVSQLEAGVKFLFNALDAKSQKLPVAYEAILCSPPFYPSKNTSLSSEAVRFLENYGVALFEKNEKTFA